MIVEEKTISSEMIYEGAILNLRRDTVTVKNGKTSKREIIEHDGGVVICGVTADGKIPMIRQYRKAVEDTVLELPAGKLEGKEDPAEAAKREFREETGYTAERWEHICSFFPTVGYSEEILHIYFAQDLTPGETEFDEHEAIDIYEYEPEELMKMLYAGEIIDGKTIAALLLVIPRAL